MFVLLDEGVPEPLSVILAMLEPAHSFKHVNDLKWMGVKDPELFRRAAKARFDVIVALDRNQLANAAEWKALKKAKLHHVSIRQTKQTEGARGQMRMLASLAVAMPRALDDLEAATGGQVVEISIISDRKRHTMRPYREHERVTRTL
jgi:PIN like domain